MIRKYEKNDIQLENERKDGIKVVELEKNWEELKRKTN